MSKFTSFKSLQDAIQSGEIEVHREVEVAFHTDENIANNRLFVWHFEEIDLEEFINAFQLYKDSQINENTRDNLATNLKRKMSEMLREGYNPIECMLYASKVINMRLQNDKELQDILAERICEIYQKQPEDSLSVIYNIMEMWSWVPQLKVIIAAVGRIGDNQDLFDRVMVNYSDDTVYKSRVFHALLIKHSQQNLDRLLKMVMNLKDTEEDNMLGRIFLKEISNFGYEGMKIVEKYYDNPSMSKKGAFYLKKAMLNSGNFLNDDHYDELYVKKLSSQSAKDDAAYNDFVKYCYEQCDNEVLYQARFSRPDIGDFIKYALEEKSLDDRSRNAAIISMGYIGAKGYNHAGTVLSKCEQIGGNDFATIIAFILLGRESYADRLVDLFCEREEYSLSPLYTLLKASTVAKNPLAKDLIRDSIAVKFNNLVRTKDFLSLERLTANLQIFHEKNLWDLIPRETLDDMLDLLRSYAEDTNIVTQPIAIAILNTVIISWNADVEQVLFALYNNCENYRVQELSFKKLKSRNIEPPK